MDIELDQLAAGSDEDNDWVTLGFESRSSTIEALHIVCGRQEDPTPGFQGLYFERADQSRSGYDLAEAIVVEPHALTIRFKEAGQKILGLSRITRFLLSPSLEGRVEVMEGFQRMAQNGNGGVLDLRG